MKVVIGGLLAIPIAYLLVFWIFKQDPLDVGPKLGKVVPFLVPSEFRDNAIDDVNNESKNKDDEPDTTDGKNADELPIPDVDPDLIMRDASD